MPTASQNSAAFATSAGFVTSRLPPRMVLTPGVAEAAVGSSSSISSSSSSSTSSTSSPSTSSSSEAAG
jgi:hypothetical protein